MKIDKRALGNLEEDIEYSNVTSLRESLLGVVKHLGKNPAKRYFITKHGRPQAVLMSFPTYTLLKKTMNQAMEQAAGKSQEERLSDAFARLRAERPYAAALEPEPEVTHVTPLAANKEEVFRPEYILNELARIRATYFREKSKALAGRVGRVAGYTPRTAPMHEVTQALQEEIRRLDNFLEKEKQAWKKQSARRVVPVKYENV